MHVNAFRCLLVSSGTASLINLPNCSSSSETQGWLVGSRKMATKVSMNRWGSPWDTTVNKPVPWLIQMLVCDWAQKIRGQHLSTVFMIFLYKGVYLQTRLFPLRPWKIVSRIRLACAGELLGEDFSVKMSSKGYSTSFFWSSCIKLRRKI